MPSWMKGGWVGDVEIIMEYQKGESSSVSSVYPNTDRLQGDWIPV